MPANDPNFLSTQNSSTTLLANAAVFTGVAENAVEYNSVVVSILSDQAGTLSCAFSSDGTNWDHETTAAVVASVAKVVSVSVKAKFYRTKFTNSGGGTQTVMRLQTLLTSMTAPADASGATEATLAAQSAKLPATLGQKTMANSMAVAIASDQSTIPVKSGSLLAGIAFDYFSIAETDADTETYTYKTGGSGGTTVATVVINYTSSAKTLILNCTRT